MIVRWYNEKKGTQQTTFIVYLSRGEHIQKPS